MRKPRPRVFNVKQPSQKINNSVPEIEQNKQDSVAAKDSQTNKDNIIAENTRNRLERKKRLNSTNGQDKKESKFSLKRILRDPIWQSVSVGVAILLPVLTFFIGVWLGKEKKFSPISIPNHFVAYSNNDFGISLPYQVNQNKSILSRAYLYDLKTTESDKDKMLQIMVTEGNDVNPEEESDADFEKSKEEIQKAMSKFGNENMEWKVLKHEQISFQGNKGTSMTMEINAVDEDEEPIKMTLKFLSFFNRNNKKLYIINYTPDTVTEQIISTLNVSKAE
jgi:hypothetical protein